MDCLPSGNVFVKPLARYDIRTSIWSHVGVVVPKNFRYRCSESGVAASKSRISAVCVMFIIEYVPFSLAI